MNVLKIKSARHMLPLYILFRLIPTFIKVCVAFIFGLQTLWLIDFSKLYQLKGLEPQNRRPHFYECCDLTKKNTYVVVCVLKTNIFLEDCTCLWIACYLDFLVREYMEHILFYFLCFSAWGTYRYYIKELFQQFRLYN